MPIGEGQITAEAKFKSKRGRPRGDYSRYIGFEGPLGLKIQSIIEDGKRVREGPHVVTLANREGRRKRMAREKMAAKTSANTTAEVP